MSTEKLTDQVMTLEAQLNAVTKAQEVANVMRQMEQNKAVAKLHNKARRPKTFEPQYERRQYDRNRELGQSYSDVSGFVPIHGRFAAPTTTPMVRAARPPTAPGAPREGSSSDVDGAAAALGPDDGAASAEMENGAAGGDAKPIYPTCVMITQFLLSKLGLGPKK